MLILLQYDYRAYATGILADTTTDTAEILAQTLSVDVVNSCTFYHDLNL